MSSYSEFLINNKSVEMDINAGKIKVFAFGDKVFDGAYVSGDMEDKLGQTVRAYKALAQYLLATLEEKEMEASDEEGNN
jgi:hypothetical protein